MFGTGPSSLQGSRRTASRAAWRGHGSLMTSRSTDAAARLGSPAWLGREGGGEGEGEGMPQPWGKVHNWLDAVSVSLYFHFYERGIYPKLYIA